MFRMVSPVLKALVLPASLVAIWTLSSSNGWVDPLFLPPPSSVLRAALSLLSEGALIRDAGATLTRSVIGCAASFVIGVPIGLAVGWSRPLARATEPTFDFLRSIPATALLPLLVARLGVGDAFRIGLVMYASVFVLVVATVTGALRVNRTRLESIQMLGASRWQLFWKVLVPEAMPEVLAALRIAISMSLVLIVVSEMFVGANEGLGYRIVTSQARYASAEAVACIITVGIGGYALNRLAVWLEMRIGHWAYRK